MTQPAEHSGLDAWQFSLRDLLIVMVWGSVASLLVTVGGMATLIGSFGVGSSGLKAAGRAAVAERPRVRLRMLMIAWLLMTVSLFLPAMRGCGTSPIPGWQAGVAAVELEYNMLKDVAQAPRQDWPSIGPGLLLLTSLNLANLLFLLSPLVLYALRRKHPAGTWLSAVYLVSLVGVWSVPIDAPSDYLSGYYVWCAAHTLWALALPLSGRTWTVMALTFVTVLYWRMRSG